MVKRKSLWKDDRRNSAAIQTDDNSNEFDLKIDKAYAKNYEEKKQREEYSKLKEIHGGDIYSNLSDQDHLSTRGLDDQEGSNSSSSEEEDEIGELITPELDAQILRTISLIRSKDPVVYDGTKNFFEESEMKNIRLAWKQRQLELRNQPKKLTLKDYERDQILAGMDEAFPSQTLERSKSDSSSLKFLTTTFNKLPSEILDDTRSSHKMKEYSSQKPSLTLVQEQERARQELMNAFSEFEANTQDNERRDTNENGVVSSVQGGLFRHRIKSREQLDQEEEAYRKFILAEEEKEREKRAEDLAALRRFWTDPNLDENERFLRE